MSDTTITRRPGPDPEWLAAWRASRDEARGKAAVLRAEVIERLGHDGGWGLIDGFDAAKNDDADLGVEYALALLADYFPSLAFAIRGFAPHILEHLPGREWGCCSAIDRD